MRCIVGSALALFSPALTEGWQAYGSGWIALASTAPWMLLWLLFWVLSRRPLSSGLMVVCTCALLMQVNELKLRNLGLPLAPSDAFALSQVASSPELYWRYLQMPFALAGWALGLLLVGLREPAQPRLRGARRAGLALVSIALLTGMAARQPPWPWLYDQQRLDIRFWHPASAVASSGLTAYFMLMQQNTRSELPAVDEDQLPSILEALPVSEGTTHPVEMPDLIVVQSESLFDPGDLVGMDGRDWLPHLYRLQDANPHGRLRVPAFGGLTTRTEFEFLTGYPLAAAPAVQYPYQGLIHSAMPALPWLLREHGYHTHAVHPYHRRFYARDQVYPLLGFDTFHSMSDFSQDDVHGYYVADQALLQHLQVIADNPSPRFVFAVSIENHGPWDEQRPLPDADLPALPEGIALEPEAALQLRRYLHHLKRADQMLADLAAWVEQRERPTIVLFYGDHLPNLVDVFANWPFRNGRHATEQTVPWLLLDNRRPSSERIDLDSSQLAAHLLHRMGLNNDPWFARIEALRTMDPDPETRRLEWHTQLAADRLRQPIRAAAKAEELLEAADLVTLRAFGPRSIEQDALGERELGFWFSFEQAPPPQAFLSVGGERLRVHERRDGLVTAALEPPAAQALVERPGSLNVELVDPIRKVRQTLGELTVRPRAERIGNWWGWGGGPFCAIVQWGPEELFLERAAELYPDGRAGIWVKAGCLPENSRLVVEGRELSTTVDDMLATGPLQITQLKSGQHLQIELRTAESRLPVGTLRVH